MKILQAGVQGCKRVVQALVRSDKAKNFLAILGVGGLCIASTAQLQAQTNPTTLQISATGANVSLGWNSGGTLQYASSLGGPWTTVSSGVSVSSSGTFPASSPARYFRVVLNGVAGPPVSLLPNSLSAPLQVETASLQLLPTPVAAGNTLLVLTLAPGSLSSSNVVTLLVNDEITLLRDDGQFPDQIANDGNFSTVINVNPSDLDAWNAELTSLPPGAQFTYVFNGRAIVGTNALQPFSTSNFQARAMIPFIDNRARPFFLGPCSGSPVAYDPGKTVMITNLSVVQDTNRTWDNNGPPTANGVGGVGTQMGAWTFGKLMTDMANTPVTGISPSDFVMHWLQSWQFQQTINDDIVTNEPNIQALVVQPWLAASQAEGLPTNTLDLAIAPFRLLAIANRVDLRGNSTYGATSPNSCIPPELAGEARFVFGFIDTNLAAGGAYPQIASNQLTVILEYAVPISGCGNVQNWGAQWAALNNISFTAVAGNPLPFSHDLQFNKALQAITDQFAKANANPSEMPNKSAIAQVRANDDMETWLFPQIWALRQFNIDATTGFLVESTVNAKPAATLNATATLEAFIAGQNNSLFCTVGPLLAAPSITIPTMDDGASFLGGWAPEGFTTSSNGIPNSMFWVGTDCANPCTRHILSLNTCNACHSQETATSFTHITPRAINVASTLSGFLTGELVPDPSGCSADIYNYSDLQRRVQDLNALVTCGCDAEIMRPQLLMSH